MKSIAVRFLLALGSCAAGTVLVAAPPHWVERYLDFNPDFGSGAVESIVAVCLLALGVVLLANVFGALRHKDHAELAVTSPAMRRRRAP
jgi:hypothetical protein